jgi:hypothetical protein
MSSFLGRLIFYELPNLKKSNKIKKNMWQRIMVITDWFGEMVERYRLVKDFNRAAKNSFIIGVAPTMLEVKITKGDYTYRHAFSKWMAGGFRIKALSGRPLQKSELIEIGRVVLDNEQLTRKLISLGWDTLEVHSNEGYIGAKWALKDYANIGGFLN